MSTTAHGGGPGAAQQVGHQPDGALGGGQADALGPGGGRQLEPLERERQVGPPLVAGHGMDLVDDHGLDRSQHRPAAGAVTSR